MAGDGVAETAEGDPDDAGRGDAAEEPGADGDGEADGVAGGPEVVQPTSNAPVATTTIPANGRPRPTVTPEG